MELYVEHPGLGHEAAQGCLKAAIAVFEGAGADPARCSNAAFERDVDADLFPWDPDDDQTVSDAKFLEFVAARRPSVDLDEEGRLADLWDAAVASAQVVAAAWMPNDPPTRQVLKLRPRLTTEQEIMRQEWIELAMAEYRRAGLNRAQALTEAMADWEALTGHGEDPELAQVDIAPVVARTTADWLKDHAGEPRPAYLFRAERQIEHA